MFCYGISRTRGVRQFWLRICMADQTNPSVSHRWGKTVIMIGLLLFSSVSVALHFTNRIENVMTRYGLIVSERVSYDPMHLQIQFLMGILSLAVIAVIMVVLYLKNFNYLYYEARMDGLTGLMRREQFFQAGKARLEKMWNKGAKKAGCFVILDVDYFKEFNDQYGHPMGDKILKEVAAQLQREFGSDGIIGRLGGDEFVVLVYEPMEKQEIEGRIDRFRREMGQIRVQDKTVTCSIGVIPAEKGLAIEELYRSGDRLLYEAKKKGKNQCVFGYRYKD